MPPKKGGDGPKQAPLIGRFGTSLKIGIVGLPNVGWVHGESLNIDLKQATDGTMHAVLTYRSNVVTVMPVVS